MTLLASNAAFETARQNMVLGQLVPNRIQNSAILDAMGAVPKEYFLPERNRNKAYADEAILVNRQSLMFSPLIFANLLLLAEPVVTDFVLNLKAGMGYSTAVLAQMTHAVVGIESDASVCEQAEKIFIDNEIDNAVMLNRNPDNGFVSQAPYDIIFIDSVIPQIPEIILSQLADEGRLVAVIAKPTDTYAKATKVTKRNGIVSYTKAFDVDLNVLDRVRTYKKFVFEGIS